MEITHTVNEEICHQVGQKFQSLFGGQQLLVRSPGRVNIIGEHTDYNNGFVLPAAIDKAIYVAVHLRNDDKINLWSEEFHESVETSLTDMMPDKKVWPNYILGVVDQFKKKGYQINGFNLVIGGDVPIGSGLSSSAAVECATAFALNQLLNLSLSRKDLAFIAQKAEHEYAGVRVGIMDQFASLFGKKDHVIKLDCQSLEYEYVPFKLQGYKILLLNTNVKHSLGSSEYNMRRQQCEKGVALVKPHYKNVNSLRDVTLEMLENYVKPVDLLVFKRCKYVIDENNRLLQACEDLKKGNLDALGHKMFQSHDGLSKEYEVSCKELDFLVNQVRNRSGVIGARMMGGGFGGCTINIVKDDKIDDLISELKDSYFKNMHLKLTAYIAQIEDGTIAIL
ncbi:MAG: galactokinase [Flavisolibacter sp.]